MNIEQERRRFRENCPVSLWAEELNTISNELCELNKEVQSKINLQESSYFKYEKSILFYFLEREKDLYQRCIETKNMIYKKVWEERATKSWEENKGGL